MRFILCVLIGLIVNVNLASAETKIAYVDLQRALLETDDGKKAKAQLEKMKTDRQSKLDAEQQELRTMQQNLEAQRAIMVPAKLEEKKMEFAKRLQQLQMTYATLQKELAAEEARLTRGILDRMGVILMKMGRSQGFSMILEKTESRILWAPQSLDLTNELIRRYNAGEGKRKAGKKPAKK